MPALKNQKHEAFARNVGIKGMSAAEAYRTGWPKASNATAETNGPELARNAQVKLRIEELRQEAARRAAEKDFLTVEEKRRICAGIARSKPADAGPDNPLSVLAMSKAGPYYTFPDKIAAIKLDNDLAVDGAEAGANKALEIIIRKL